MKSVFISVHKAKQREKAAFLKSCVDILWKKWRERKMIVKKR